MTTQRWLGWANVILGAWLIASPWLLTATEGDRAADWNSWSVGAGVVLLGLFAIYKHTQWGDIAGISLGAWLIASPWMLGFSGASLAAANAVIIGLLVSSYALWAMRIDATLSGGASGDGAAAPDAYRPQLKLQSAQAVDGRTRV